MADLFLFGILHSHDADWLSAAHSVLRFLFRIILHIGLVARSLMTLCAQDAVLI